MPPRSVVSLENSDKTWKYSSLDMGCSLRNILKAPLVWGSRVLSYGPFVAKEAIKPVRSQNGISSLDSCYSRRWRGSRSFASNLSVRASFARRETGLFLSVTSASLLFIVVNVTVVAPRGTIRPAENKHWRNCIVGHNSKYTFSAHSSSHLPVTTQCCQ